MAFLRFTRDKRGYQHFYLVEPIANRRGKVRQRVLYWFRSPPDIKVGREPFDESVRRALEAQNPDVIFDWRSILEAPIPSADTEKWRERRRAERAAKQALAATAAEDESDEAEPSTSAAGREDSEPSLADTARAAPVEASERSGEAARGSDENLRRKRRRRRGRRPSTTAASAESAGETEVPAGEPRGPDESPGE
jgi:hypothetical protein